MTTPNGLFGQLEHGTTGLQVNSLEAVLDAIPWNSDGLIAAVAQQHDTGEVLMLAWMNREALVETLQTQRVCYWSRSRQTLWRKGETSGCQQRVVSAALDCDGDAVLLRVAQDGEGACHTGRYSCFYNALDQDGLTVTSDRPEKHD